jgi:hypothetical protein
MEKRKGKRMEGKGKEGMGMGRCKKKMREGRQKGRQTKTTFCQKSSLNRRRTSHFFCYFLKLNEEVEMEKNKFYFF